MKIEEKQANQTKHKEAFRKRKTHNTWLKNLSPDHPSKISTRQNSCSTQGHYEPFKPTSLHVLEPSKL